MSNVLDIIRTAETNPPAPSTAELTTPAEFQGYEDEENPFVTPAWRIEDKATADWALRRYGECLAEAADIEAQYQAAVAHLTERRDALKAKANRGAGFFEFKLAEYAGRCRGDLLKGKSKTATFLHGAIKFRAKQDRLEVVDKAALEEWLRAQPVESGIARWKVEPEMKALQDQFKKTGECPPGCDVKPAEETVTIDAIAPERALTKGE